MTLRSIPSFPFIGPARQRRAQYSLLEPLHASPLSSHSSEQVVILYLHPSDFQAQQTLHNTDSLTSKTITGPVLLPLPPLNIHDVLIPYAC